MMVGALTSYSRAVAFSGGVLGQCERLLADTYPVGFALSLDQRRFGWVWRIWDSKGEMQLEDGEARESRAEAVESLYAHLKEEGE